MSWLSPSRTRWPTWRSATTFDKQIDCELPIVNAMKTPATAGTTATGTARSGARAASEIVQAWCEAEHVPYERVPPARAWRDVLAALDAVGAELREEGGRAPISS